MFRVWRPVTVSRAAARMTPGWKVVTRDCVGFEQEFLASTRWPTHSARLTEGGAGSCLARFRAPPPLLLLLLLVYCTLQLAVRLCLPELITCKTSSVQF